MASTGEAWRLGRRPALDGLRGVAALTVVAAHSHLPIGGGVAVNLFFALSGFLITSLLLEELEVRGRIQLRAFYARRARRLMPALYVMLAVVLLVGAAFELGSWWGRPSVYVASALYLSNFLSAAGVSSALGHTWSLAIEEQFYLTWPLIVLVCARRSRRLLMWVAIGVACTSTAWIGVLAAQGAPEWRLGFGVDTRIAPILAGCALAAWMRDRSEGSARPRVAVALLSGLAVLSFVDQAWVTPASAVLAAGLLWAACQGEPIRVLSGPTMRWLGDRSYGLYLWHYPLALLSDHVAPGVTSPLRCVILVSVGLVAAELSWRFVEQPCLRRARPRAPVAAMPRRGRTRTASIPKGPSCSPAPSRWP